MPTFISSQILHSGPKDSIRFFLQNTYFSLQMTTSFTLKIFPVTTDYLIFTAVCPFSPLEIISSFIPTIFSSYPLLTDNFAFTLIHQFSPLQINSDFTPKISTPVHSWLPQFYLKTFILFPQVSPPKPFLPAHYR